MADKKQKVSVASYESAPSVPQDAEEEVTVDLGNGVMKTVYRGSGARRLSDKRWAQVIALARADEAKKRQQSDGADDVDAMTERLNKVGKSADKAVEDAQLPDNTDAMTERLNKVAKPAEQAAADAKLPEASKKPRYEVKSGEMTVEDAPQYEVKSGELTVEPLSDADQVEEDLAPVKASADKAVEDAQMPPTPKSKGGQQSKPQPVAMPKGGWGRGKGLAFDPRNPATALPQMAMGTLPVTQKSQAPLSPDEQAELDSMRGREDLSDAEFKRFQSLSGRGLRAYGARNEPPVEITPDPVVAPTQYYGKGADGSYSASNDETEQVPQPSTFDQAAHVIGNLPGTIGRAAATLTGSDPNAPPAVTLADPLDRPSAPPGAGQAAAAAPGAGGMGGSASVSASSTTRTPGRGVVPPSAPDAYTKAVQDNAQLMQDQLNLKTELESKQLAGEARIQSEARVKAAELAAGDQARRTAELQEARKYEQGLAGLQNEVLQASKESVDPNRYWNSRDTGQKVAGIIAGALFGFTGQGMQWLQRVDGLIAQDMQAQAADLARKRGYLQDAAGLQNNLIAMAEKRGLKGDAAYTAAKLAMTENIAAQLEANAAQYQDQNLRIKATEAAQAIRMNAQKDLMMYDQEKQDAIAKRSLMKAQENHLYSQMANERMALELKAAKDNEDLDKVDPAAASTITEARTALEAIKQARALLGGDKGGWETFKDQYGKNVVKGLRAVGAGDLAPVLAPDVSNRMAAVAQLVDSIYKGATGENIMKDDRPLIEERTPSPGFSAKQQQWLDTMEEFANARIAAATKTQREAGRNTRRMTVPTLQVPFTPKGK